MAKLKSVFDRFDTASDGRLTGSQIEQLLLYMNRPVDSVQVHTTAVLFVFAESSIVLLLCGQQVNTWLLKLKDNALAIDFPEFVSQYSVSYV